MEDETRVQQLLEELLESSGTPEEICRDFPELLPVVRERWERLKRVEAQVEEFFPSAASTRGAILPSHIETSLPHIPGYEVECLLGHGGMGVVYKARHLTLKRPVAIKMLLAGIYASATERQRLLREAQAVAALCHPNIVMVHDVGEFEGRPYFTMEFVGDGNLAKRLAGTPQPARDAAALVATLADATQSAHQAGIIHRDLKPANVLLTPDGTPKITDFGLARHFEGEAALTLSGVRVGTPSYMAPEQANCSADAMGPSVDIYSLGALLYEMLTGRPPFRAETAMETHRQVIEEEPAPPSRLNSMVPRDLETICLKCLQKSPLARYASAGHLKDDLQRYLRGEPISARRIGTAVRVVKWARRHPGHAGAWTGAVAAITAILGAMLWTVSERAAISRAVSDDLAEVVGLEEASEWHAARNMLERAKMRLGSLTSHNPLAMRASEIESELDLVDRLGAMRFERAASRDVEFDRDKWWNTYRGLFAEAGFLAEGDTPETFAARVARSPARTAIVGALDDMAICATTGSDLAWLLNTTRLADPDPWRDRVRDSAAWGNDLDSLAALAREAPVESQPASLLLNVAGRLLDDAPVEAESLLRRIQVAHPSDFWANFALAECLGLRGDADAIGYYRAAIAIKPEATAAHINLAIALHAGNRIQEAIDTMGRAVVLDPRSWVAQYDLAGWLLQHNRREEAIYHARIATQIDHPQQSHAHRVLGRALAQLGQYCDAAESFRRAVELSPEDDQLRTFLARALSECEASKAPASQQGP